MTDRQVAIIAVVTVLVLVGGGAILARIQPDIRAVDMSGSREHGGERERADSGEKSGGKSGGSGSDAGGGSGGGSGAERGGGAKSDHGAGGHAVTASAGKGDVPAAAHGLLLARWEKAADDSGARRLPPETVAVDNAGARVLVQAARAVDVWTADSPKARRVQPKSARSAFVAPDGARMYFVNSEKSGWRLETCDADGARVGVWGPDGGRWGELGAVGFHPATHEMTVGIGFEGGYALQAISPASGQPQPTRVVTQAADALSADRLFPHAGGHLIHFHTFQGAGHPPGLYALTAAGVERTTAVPTDAAPSAVLPRPAVAPDGHHVAVLDGATVRVSDLKTGKRLFSWELAGHRPKACWFAGGRLMVAAVGERATGPRPVLFQTYDLGSFRLLGQFRPGDHALPATAFAFSPDGSKLALAGDDVALVDANVAFGLVR